MLFVITPEDNNKKKNTQGFTKKKYHNGLLDCLLNLHTLSSDGLIQFSLKGQEVHVSLRLGDQVSDL